VCFFFSLLALVLLSSSCIVLIYLFLIRGLDLYLVMNRNVHVALYHYCNDIHINLIHGMHRYTYKHINQKDIWFSMHTQFLVCFLCLKMCKDLFGSGTFKTGTIFGLNKQSMRERV
jgi:hypothetical protein